MLILRLKPLDTMFENRQKFISFLTGLAAILVLKSDLVKWEYFCHFTDFESRIDFFHQRPRIVLTSLWESSSSPRTILIWIEYFSRNPVKTEEYQNPMTPGAQALRWLPACVGVKSVSVQTQPRSGKHQAQGKQCRTLSRTCEVSIFSRFYRNLGQESVPKVGHRYS